MTIKPFNNIIKIYCWIHVERGVGLIKYGVHKEELNIVKTAGLVVLKDNELILNTSKKETKDERDTESTKKS